MKKIILLSSVICAILIISCNNRDDYFYNITSGPVLEVYNPVSQSLTTGNFSDSAKIGVMYSTNFTMSAQTSASVTANELQGSDSLGVTGDKIYIMPKSEGLSKIAITATDKLSKTSSVNLDLTVFRNLLPIVVFTATQVQGGLSPYEINIDASQSYDKDSKWGGRVVAYKFKINTNYDVTTPLSSIRYIFDSAGQKEITVSVQDNNGDWSAEQTVYLVVQ
jgi:hypothetical protein